VIRALSGGNARFDLLSQRDRGFALRLLRETEVWRLRLDRSLSAYCRTPLHRLDTPVLAALRAGAAQLLVLNTPPHAAVAATVEAVTVKRAAGLVNAVLRRLQAEGEPEGGELFEIWSHPRSLVRRGVSEFGRERAEALMEWNNGVPELGGWGPEEKGSGRYLRGYRALPRTGTDPLETAPEGLYVQDESAAIVAESAAQLANGETVLEIGAAPGGKTHHLSSNASYVVSMDSSRRRMDRWRENACRLNWRDALPVVALGEFPPFRRDFGLVLLDAPCTNTGVYRRRFDARWNWSPERLATSVLLQKKLLRAASGLVSPGGILFYSTCSLEEEENRMQVKSFSEEASDFETVSLPAEGELVKDGMICIFPTEHHMDGHFAAAWRRKA